MIKKVLLSVFIFFAIITLMATAVNTNDGSLYIGGNASGVGTGVPISATTVNINYSTAATTSLISAVNGKSIYITHIHILAAGTTNVSLVYGTTTTTPCDTGTTTLDGPLPLTAQTGYSAGTGFGAIEVIPSGNALCLTNSQAIQVGGAVSVSQN